MVRRRRFSLRPRWAVPTGAVMAVGGVLAGTVFASAAPPALPRKTPAQLIASLRSARMPSAFSATLTESANLGLPSLPSIGGMSSSPMSAMSLLTGSHTIQVWAAGPRHLRVALPVSFGETDLRVNGNQVWLWQSQGQKATRIVAPAPAKQHMRTGTHAGQKKAAPAGKTPGPDWAKLSPLQAAKKALALVGPTTRVTIPGTTTVAGRNAYQLAIAPRTKRSLVGRILIAIDAKTHLPLSVQVFARGSSSAAFAIRFTSLSFAKPAMSNFTFTPPPGAHVKTLRPKAARVGLHNGWSGYPPAAAKKALAPAKKASAAGKKKTSALREPPAAIRKLPAGVQTIGTGWLSVLAIPSIHAMPFASGHAPSGAGLFTPAKGGTAAYHSKVAIVGPAGFGPGGIGPAMLAALAKAARPVHGSWGSGRLLHTNLVSVLITSKGQVLVGAVTPKVLFADVAKVK